MIRTNIHRPPSSLTRPSPAFSWFQQRIQCLPTGNPALTEKIHAFAIQYLARGSKWPLPSQAETNPLPRSPIEYYKSPQATYYRSEGSGSLHFLKDTFKEIIPDLQKISFFCLGSDFFSNILHHSLTQHISVHSKEEFLTVLNHLQQQEGTCYLDVSSWISQPEGLKEFTSLQEKTPPNLLAGGIVHLSSVPVFVHLENTDKSAEKNVRRFIHATGSEISFMEASKALQKLGVCINLPSNNAEDSNKNVYETFNQIQNKLTKLKTKYPNNFHYSFALNNLDILQKIRAFEEKPEILNALSIIENNVQDPMSHYHVDLIFEEIYLLLSICEKSSLDPDLTQVIFSKAPQMEGISPSLSLHTSGMMAFTHLLHSLYQKTKHPLKVLHSKGSYFGYESVLRMHSRIIHSQIDTFSSSIKEPLPQNPYNVVFLDIHANNMTARAQDLKHMRADEVRHLIVEPCLANRTEPFTLVVDISTTLFQDDEVEEFVLKHEDLIQEGKLNLIFVSSLAKFSLCGLDKCTGGFLLSYSKIPLEETHLKMCTDSQELVKLLILSESQIPYKNQSLIAKTNLMNKIKQLVRTNPVFSSIFEVLDPQDEKIPAIALRFKNDDGSMLFQNLATLSTDYLSRHGLLKRMSFAYMHPNVNACASTLRISAGLSEDETQEKIIFMLENLAKNLQIVLSTQEAKDKLKSISKISLASEEAFLSSSSPENPSLILDIIHTISNFR